MLTSIVTSRYNYLRW